MSESTVDPETEQRLAEHHRRYHDLAAQISQLGFISRGSVTRRFTTCGTASCRCHADPPQRHGPYYQWTRKVAGKTVTRRLSHDEAELYQQWIANARRLDAIIAAMEDLSQDAAELLLDHASPTEPGKRSSGR